MTSDTSSAVSASRPKNRSRSSAVYGRGPTYGAFSVSTTVTVGLPAILQLVGEVDRGPPVHAQLQRAEVPVQVVARGVAGRQLDGDAQAPQARLRRSDDPAVDDAEVPVGELVADEQQRCAREPALDLVRQQLRVTCDRDEEVEIVVLGQDERL